MIRLYAAAGILLVILGLAATALWYRGSAIAARADRDRARADLVVAAEANASARRTIGALQEQARMDSRLSAELLAEMRRINEAVTAQAEALTQLESTDADVRGYLDTPVPDALRGLYDR